LSGGFSASLWVLLSGVPKRLNSVITKKENLFFLIISGWFFIKDEFY